MPFDQSRPIPILFLADAPETPSGLGRIAHDLAWLVSSMPEFKLGYLGRGATGRSRFPWIQYSYPAATGQWGENYLEACWNDLAKQDRGIIFTIWDASRLLWFADGRDTPQQAFLQSGRFERWGYFMADGSGANPNQLPLEQSHVISQYNRALTASEWASGLASSIEGPELDWLPHPINREVFKPLDRSFIRSAWGIAEEAPLIGCVMANQARKHWPVVLEAVARFSKLQSNVANPPRLWMHTDTLLAYWDLRALAVEYNLLDQIIVENRGLTDAELAMRYSACDMTVVISGGEGFCYPVAESLSCGVPCITGDYGAQAELTHWHVKPVASMIDTSHNVRRAAYQGWDVMSMMMFVWENRHEVSKVEELVTHLNMKELGLVWKKWFRRGL